MTDIREALAEAGLQKVRPSVQVPASSDPGFAESGAGDGDADDIMAGASMAGLEEALRGMSVARGDTDLSCAELSSDIDTCDVKCASYGKAVTDTDTDVEELCKLVARVGVKSRVVSRQTAWLRRRRRRETLGLNLRFRRLGIEESAAVDIATVGTEIATLETMLSGLQVGGGGAVSDPTGESAGANRAGAYDSPAVQRMHSVEFEYERDAVQKKEKGAVRAQWTVGSRYSLKTPRMAGHRPRGLLRRSARSF